MSPELSRRSSWCAYTATICAVTVRWCHWTGTCCCLMYIKGAIVNELLADTHLPFAATPLNLCFGSHGCPSAAVSCRPPVPVDEPEGVPPLCRVAAQLVPRAPVLCAATSHSSREAPAGKPLSALTAPMMPSSSTNTVHNQRHTTLQHSQTRLSSVAPVPRAAACHGSRGDPASKQHLYCCQPS